MVKKIFLKPIHNITIAASLVAASSLVSRFLGIVRDRILAGEFGAGETLDIYYAAFRIPDLIFNLLVLGALSAGFIPIFSSLINSKKQDKKEINKKSEAWFLASNTLNILGIGLILLSLLGIIFTPYLMKIIVPGFNKYQLDLTIELTRIMFLSPIFLGISSVFGGILQSFKRFCVYSLAPIMYNLGIIFGVLFLVPIFGIYGLAWGVVIGAVLHMLVQLFAVIQLDFKYTFKIDLKNKNTIKVGIMMIPRVMALAINQINLLVITVIASKLTSGSLAIFNLANNLGSFPVGVFGISFAVAVFPTLSLVAFDKKKLIENFSITIRQILFFIIPTTVLLITLRAQIIRVILGTGQFNWNDTVLTIDVLGFFALSLFAQAIIPLLVRVFYARHNSYYPFLIGLVTAIINVILSLYFSSFMGVSGLALAFSISAIFNFIFLWLTIRFSIGFMDEEKILFSTLKFVLAAVFCGATVQGMKLLIHPYINMTKFWGVFIQGAFAGLVGIFIYLAVCFLLKSEEFMHFYSSLKRRLKI